MTTTYEHLVERQVEMERDMVRFGQERAEAARQKLLSRHQLASTKSSRQAISRLIDPYAAAIQRFVEEDNRGRHRPAVAARYLRESADDTAADIKRRNNDHDEAGDEYVAEVVPGYRRVAFVAARAIINSLTRSMTYQSISKRVGWYLQHDTAFGAFEKEHPGYYKRVLDEFKTKKFVSSDDRRTRELAENAKKLGLNLDQWPEDDWMQIGNALIDLFSDVTGFTQLVPTVRRVMRKGKSVATNEQKLIPTQQFLDWMEGQDERNAVMSPMYLPMVIPPRPWMHPNSRPYLTDAVLRFAVVKTRRAPYLEELRNRVDDMPVVYKAINALQDTAWRVNSRVHDVAKELWASRSTACDLPSQERLPMPPIPAGLDPQDRASWDEEQTKSWKRWKASCHRVYEANLAVISRRIATAKTFWVAGMYEEFSAIYFPHQYDFRGRVYCVPAYLNPQGTDLSKGLLTFAEGKPISTKEQADWLAIHGAGLYGVDKVSLEDRVAWIEANREAILASAANPLDVDWWTKADKPFQFLAFCFEWAEFLEAGLGYVSHLPVTMDGTCNGLQIFSLLLRDEVGGAAVNLVPGPKPADIYQVVADKVIDRLHHLAVHGQEVVSKQTGKVLYHEVQMAQQWLAFGLDRKGTKRPVMVLPYGGTAFSCREYIEEYCYTKAEKCPKEWRNKAGEPHFFKPSLFLSALVWDAIGSTVIAAKECMAWLQGVARIAAKEGLPVTWTTPDGFPVLQSYPNLASRRVKMRIGETVLRVSITEEQEDKIDKRRQASGISPNYVHSLDGAALRITVARCVEQGVSAFAMVHDSYGTHAADAPVLARTLREVFVETFSDDLLARFAGEMQAVVSSGQELPCPPDTGALDISKVLESRFFFA